MARSIERALSRRDVPLREKTLWRMLYETAARTQEVLSADVTDLDLENKRLRVRRTSASRVFTLSVAASFGFTILSIFPFSTLTF